MCKSVDLSYLADKWPSAIVAREKFGEFSGGLVDPKTLANADSLGTGPDGAMRIGKKIAYPVANAITWLESKASIRRAA